MSRFNDFHGLKEESRQELQDGPHKNTSRAIMREGTDADDGDGFRIAGPQRSFRPMNPLNACRSDRLSIEQ